MKSVYNTKMESISNTHVNISNPKFQKELRIWIDALDSGKYTQTTLSLQDNTGHCCLGVGCEVLIPREKQKRGRDNLLLGGLPHTQDNAPEWFLNINTDFKNRIGERLSSMNDAGHFTFSAIATLLELVYIHQILE